MENSEGGRLVGKPRRRMNKRQQMLESRETREGLDTPSGCATPQKSIAIPSRPQATQAALLSSLSGRPFEDMKFFAFSRRSRSKTVDTPRPILVNSMLLRSTSTHFEYGEWYCPIAALTQAYYMEALGCMGGFSESDIANLDAPYPSDRSDKSLDYGYESDSDLEDEDEQVQALSQESTLGIHSIHCASTAESSAVHTGKEHSPCRYGRVIYVDNVAHATLKSFVFYAYTGGITFARLKSQGSQVSGHTEPTSVPICSPKSMYRLADLYDIPMLKNLAKNDIKMKLSPNNILDELFSTFTSLYPEIEAFEREYLIRNIDHPVIQQKLPDWIDALAEGRLPQGAAKTVSKLILRESRTPASRPVSAFGLFD
ncbi:hypothetical protein K466DRAFT_657618 [Polyporus arcularius HHB13444]|uniref:BTB domain-containing protein n=1 Tax=Polyporus arcularius HHB13444 TaxID=1314778 RepID=A0A5C3PXZ2_9APHY|nr:hypothetical protein K466DRAFT_657618 [Polyporus arcularius HHB13444]